MEMTKQEKISCMIDYLKVLQEGRNRPNKEMDRFVRETLENTTNIESTKATIERELNISNNG